MAPGGATGCGFSRIPIPRACRSSSSGSTTAREADEEGQASVGGSGGAAQARRDAARRRRAGAPRRTPRRRTDLDGADLRRVLHELEVHEVELEMQNEELRGARTEAERGLARYTELFDFAPIGYATLSGSGTIQEVNHAGARLLGKERATL